MFKKYLCVGLAALLLIAETPISAYAAEVNNVQEILVQGMMEQEILEEESQEFLTEAIAAEAESEEKGVEVEESVATLEAEMEETAEEEVYAAEATSGYVNGTNNAISWTYDPATKTTTITGKGFRVDDYTDSTIPGETQFIVFKDCVIEGDMCGFFSWLTNLEAIDFSGLTMKNITNMSDMFSFCTKLKKVDTSKFDTSQVTNMGFMFSFCQSLEEVDVSRFDTSKVIDMVAMFQDCKTLTKLDVRNFDTSNVTDMGFMFNGCTSLTTLDVSGFNTAKVTDMGTMFYDCHSLTQLDVRNFDTSNVDDFNFMFGGCYAVKELDVSHFDIGKATGLKYMFSGCRAVTELDLSNFDMSQITDVTSMLYGCESLQILDTPKKMGDVSVALPAVFTNPSGTDTNVLTKNFENTVLFIKGFTVPSPTITKQGDNLVVKSSMPGTILYYTTDGSTPTPTHGTKVDGTSVTVGTFAGHLKAIAVKHGKSSSLAKMTLFESTKERNVSFKVTGTFGGRNVIFNSNLKGAKIYYSSETSVLSTKDKCVNPGDTVLFEDFYGTIYTRTYKDGVWGNVCRFVLKIPVVNTPTIEVDSKGYATIRTKTPASHLIYTLDGTTPSLANGRRVFSPYARVYVGKGKTIKAIAVRSCFTNSGVATKKS